ncbi:hypothetical protein Abor_031_007 [Acetobacter orientalis]|uniref:Uncharacterized protein n=1 Tax=Acetobacter orientalis TaxID=146474 RepID=A0A0D6NN61_9PROT|nr:hypothetical protein Abor_031_007 [Acetobacter orientalis]
MIGRQAIARPQRFILPARLWRKTHRIDPVTDNGGCTAMIITQDIFPHGTDSEQFGRRPDPAFLPRCKGRV